MNTGLLIILVLVGAIGLLYLGGMIMPKKSVTPPEVKQTEGEVPTTEDSGRGDYELADERMNGDLEELEARDYVDPEESQPVDNVVGFGGDVGAAL